MPVYLHAIETWNPPYCLKQSEATERIAGQLSDKRTRRIARHIYKQSAIDTRHTCIPFDGADGLFDADSAGIWNNPQTGDRNSVFCQVSKAASVELARRTLAAAPEVQPTDITHVITASCTGFYTPGPDHHIVRELGLRPETERFHLGFMGCYAAFPALRMADAICRANPQAVVLIQCLELCSLHLQIKPDNPDALVSSAIFADGAGGALVSSRPPAEKPAYEIHHLASTLVPSGENDMVWDIGNHGFDIILSSYVPQILGQTICDAVEPPLHAAGWAMQDVGFWAVHPGGKAILDRITEALNLSENELNIARDILRRFGNMSSATLFFLLKEGLTRHPPGTRTAAMAFGPGLTVETGCLERVNP
jgi:predicted naringenin-chalcone synthase